MTGDLASFTVAPSGFDTDEPAGGHSSSGRMPLPPPSFKSTPDVVPLPPMPYHHSFSLQQNPLNPVFAHGPTLYISPGVFPGAVNIIVPLTPDLASMYDWNQSMLLQPPAYPQLAIPTPAPFDTQGVWNNFIAEGGPPISESLRMPAVPEQGFGPVNFPAGHSSSAGS
ncbi:hypothetical protein HGRIS_006553 [Hohenbuehelia grisea]|uniref:Uncharacterized protein n=1 Tax=Hohenbuehelia grisea TaxID=104357 RepID=A0ABR3J996_9AGAR